MEKGTKCVECHERDGGHRAHCRHARGGLRRVGEGSNVVICDPCGHVFTTSDPKRFLAAAHAPACVVFHGVAAEQQASPTAEEPTAEKEPIQPSAAHARGRRKAASHGGPVV